MIGEREGDGEAGSMGYVFGRWRNGGRRWVGVLGSLWVSQVLSGRESGRYLIVIASMERTEAVPVRKFLIYLVFLFSLFLPHSASISSRLWGCELGERGVYLLHVGMESGAIWMRFKEKTDIFSNQVWLSPLHTLPSDPHPTTHNTQSQNRDRSDRNK